MFTWNFALSAAIDAVKKSQLPQKTCPVCRRPFVWRKKWRDCWDQVRYCSERCRRSRPRSGQ